eukprot:Selendium_serpulae@DN5904_c0_g1_i1.p1
MLPLRNDNHYRTTQNASLDYALSDAAEHPDDSGHQNVAASTPTGSTGWLETAYTKNQEIHHAILDEPMGVSEQTQSALLHSLVPVPSRAPLSNCSNIDQHADTAMTGAEYSGPPSGGGDTFHSVVFSSPLSMGLNNPPQQAQQTAGASNSPLSPTNRPLPHPASQARGPPGSMSSLNGLCFQPSDGEQMLPMANISRIMKRMLPENAKISKDAKVCLHTCVFEFLLFVTAEASDTCLQERRKTLNGDDIIRALDSLGFDRFLLPMRCYLTKWRESVAINAQVRAGYDAGILGSTEEKDIDQFAINGYGAAHSVSPYEYLHYGVSCPVDAQSAPQQLPEMYHHS